VVHEVLSIYRYSFTILIELARIEKGEKYTTRGPGELISERIVGSRWGGKTSAV